jgi:3-dehydroquinate synthase
MRRELRSGIQQSFGVNYSFPVHFTRGVFSASNPLLAETLRSAGPRRQRALLVFDKGLVAANPGLPAAAEAYARAHAAVFEWAGEPFLVRGGEVCKTDPVEVAQLQRLTFERRIDRQSFIVCAGGGAVLDAVGFAAATSHRGVRLVRLPSTVLGQDDAGIGVKNGVNAFGRKNYLGSFAPPFAVLNDLDLLRTLPPRDARAGMAEAVKVAAIKDAAFLSWLHLHRAALGALEPAALEELVFRCAQLHIEHVGGADPFELGSARPLDFGHWAAHHLEEITHSELRHGEAVAIGCALDSLYAHARGLLTAAELAVLLETLDGLGFALAHPALAQIDIAGALAAFQEHLGGELCITVPDGLGKKVELHEMDVELVRRCVAQLLARGAVPGAA